MTPRHRAALNQYPGRRTATKTLQLQERYCTNQVFRADGFKSCRKKCVIVAAASQRSCYSNIFFLSITLDIRIIVFMNENLSLFYLLYIATLLIS